MTSQLAATFNLRIGDVWDAAGRSLRVTGLVENPQDLSTTSPSYRPGSSPSEPGDGVVRRDTAERRGVQLPPARGAGLPQPPSGHSPAIIALAFAIVGLFFIGLVGVAGFTVLAQRRLRSLGILSSLGATDENIRLVLVVNGAAVGVIGARPAS